MYTNRFFLNIYFFLLVKGSLSINVITKIPTVACVASVSVRLSARSMHFSLFWPRENWGGSKKVRGGGGERGKFPFLAFPPPPRCFHQCCARPKFCAAKKRKAPPTGGKPYGNACYAGYTNGNTDKNINVHCNFLYSYQFSNVAVTVTPADVSTISENPVFPLPPPPPGRSPQSPIMLKQILSRQAPCHGRLKTICTS